MSSNNLLILYNNVSYLVKGSNPGQILRVQTAGNLRSAAEILKKGGVSDFDVILSDEVSYTLLVENDSEKKKKISEFVNSILTQKVPLNQKDIVYKYSEIHTAEDKEFVQLYCVNKNTIQISQKDISAKISSIVPFSNLLTANYEAQEGKLYLIAFYLEDKINLILYDNSKIFCSFVVNAGNDIDVKNAVNYIKTSFINENEVYCYTNVEIFKNYLVIFGEKAKTASINNNIFSVFQNARKRYKNKLINFEANSETKTEKDDLNLEGKEKPAQNKKTKIKFKQSYLVIFIVLLFLICGGVLFFYFKNQSSTPAPIIQSEPEPVIATPTPVPTVAPTEINSVETEAGEIRVRIVYFGDDEKLDELKTTLSGSGFRTISSRKVENAFDTNSVAFKSGVSSTIKGLFLENSMLENVEVSGEDILESGIYDVEIEINTADL